MTHTDDHTAPSDAREPSIWKRGLIMLVLAIFFGIAETLLVVMALVQFLWTAITGERNHAIADFGVSLSAWLAQVARYQTFSTDERPFPWADWPADDS